MDDSEKGRIVSAEQAREFGNEIGIDWNEIDFKEFRRGLEIEDFENDPYMAAEIVIYNLQDEPTYYSTFPVNEAYSDKWGRPSAAKRGYGYSWKKKRDVALEKDGNKCVKCGKKATDVDHITPKSRKGTDRPSNLRSLCGECHRKKTAAYDKRSADAKYGNGTGKTKYTFDENGIEPVEESLKTFNEIRSKFPNHNQHCLRLECGVCEAIHNCRCNSPKTTVVGICQECE
jgi:hypothetical protein